MCIFLSWYTVSATTSSGSQTYSLDLYPDQQVTVSGTSGTTTATVSGSYSDARLNNTGNLYTIVEILLILGAILGIAGGGLLIAAGTRVNASTALATALIIFGVAMAIAGPIAVFVHQPSALAADAYNAGSTNTSGPGPTSSFYGTLTVNGETGTWGPALGWYLSIAIAVLLIISVAIVPSASRETAPRPAGPAMAGAAAGAYVGYPAQYATPPPPAQPGCSQYPAAVPTSQPVYPQPPNQVSAPPPPPSSPPPPPQPAAPDERYCPACGTGNLRSSLYCEKCGRPLPPPR